MRFLLLAAICLLAMVAPSAVFGSRATPGVDCLMDAAASEAQLEDLFSSWMKQYEKSYSFAQLSDRFMKFKANVALIREHNLKANQTYTLGLNQFADLSAAEFQSEYLGVRSERRPHDSRAIAQRLKSPGYVVDWRSRGAVTPVGTQSASTGVWAYAAAGAFEGAWVAQGGHSLTSVPAEEMAECCNGIQATAVLEQIQCGFRYRGVCSVSAYRPGHCDSCRRDVTVSGYVTIPPGSEFDLFSAVTHQGPVAVQIDASGMQFYSGGIYTGPCTPATNQGMLAVGYDDDNGGTPYWILKNSWGTAWGEAGYLRLVLDQNACGIAEAASYPQV